MICQLCILTCFCTITDHHRVRLSSSSCDRTLLTQLGVGGAHKISSWSQLHPGAPTPRELYDLGKSVSRTSNTNSTWIECAWIEWRHGSHHFPPKPPYHPCCSPFSLPSPSDPERRQQRQRWAEDVERGRVSGKCEGNQP